MAEQTGQPGLSPQQIVALYQSGQSIDLIAKNNGLSSQVVIQALQQSGYKNPGQNLYNNTPDLTPGGETSGAGPVGQDSGPSGPGPGTGAAPNMPGQPGAMTPQQIQALIQAELAAAMSASGGGGASRSAAADLAERRREFDVTTQRDISKENATEVDALQKMLASLSGPKDVYADLFFSHGLLPPQGYKPAPVPLTDAQKQAYQSMGVSPQQLQTMITGTGQPGADFGMLGSLGQSLQTPGTPPATPGQAPTGAQAPANPTVQGGALYGKSPAGTSITSTSTPMAPPTTPGGVPSMAVGGTVPGPTMTPKLAVVHGGEEVTPAPGSAPSGENNAAAGGVTSIPSLQPGGQGAGGAMSGPGLHPAIAALVDAVSNLLSNPDFRPFVEAAENTAQATPGGVQSMALGGTVDPLAGGAVNNRPGIGGSGLPASSPAPVPGSAGGPIGGTNPGVMGGAQGAMASNNIASPDNPLMPLSKMDPYTRALYDVHGRLHPYSAQQEAQMGPQGVGAVNSYVGKVLGGDVNAYTDLVNRLKPQGTAPQAGDVQSEGFITG